MLILMPVLFVLPLLLLLGYSASPVSDEEMAGILTEDLVKLKLAVKSDEPLKDEEYTAQELRSLATYSQNQAMKPFQEHMQDLQLGHDIALYNGAGRLIPFIGTDQAYKLAWVLTGKDLTAVRVKPLVAGLMKMLASAQNCREKRNCRESKVSLRSSEEFRGAGESTWLALQALGVSEGDGQLVMSALFRGAGRASLLPAGQTYK